MVLPTSRHVPRLRAGSPAPKLLDEYRAATGVKKVAMTMTSDISTWSRKQTLQPLDNPFGTRLSPMLGTFLYVSGRAAIMGVL